jgi:hypothetical protein
MADDGLAVDRLDGSEDAVTRRPHCGGAILT